MVRNSIGISTCNGHGWRVDYVIRKGDKGQPLDFFQAQHKNTWYWALDGFLYKDNLWVTLLCMRDAPKSDKFEDYIAKDLVAEIDGKFRTLRSRHSRGIAGLSMGGYGALKIALRYHDDFVFAGSLSGALNAPQDLGDKRPEFRDQLLKVFGSPGSTVRAENNVVSLLQNAGPKELPYFYLACGSADDFLPVNRDFAAQLSSRGAAYEYHETAGGHAWDYWDRSVQDLLRAVAGVISGQRQ